MEGEPGGLVTYVYNAVIQCIVLSELFQFMSELWAQQLVYPLAVSLLCSVYWAFPSVNMFQVRTYAQVQKLSCRFSAA